MSEEMVKPYADDDPIDEPKEQDPDEAYDSERAAMSGQDYADLHAELVSIARLQCITSKIEELAIGLRNSLIGKPQA